MQFWFSIIFITATPFLGLWAFSDSLPFQEEVSIYTAFCGGEFKDGKCRSKEHALSKHTYKSLVDQQLVIHWGDGDAPERFSQCVVQNVRNWSCGTTGIGAVTMIDGSYRDRSTDTFYQVPKWYWWWLKLNAKTAPNTRQK